MDPQLKEAWIQFKLNDDALGYCGQFISPVEVKKKGITISHDSTSKICSIEIEKLTKDNEGKYSCSVMVPHPDGNGFVIINSTAVTLTATGADATTIGISVGVSAVLVIIIAITIIGFVYCCICRTRLNDQKCCKCYKNGYNKLDDDKKLNDQECCKCKKGYNNLKN